MLLRLLVLLLTVLACTLCASAAQRKGEWRVIMTDGDVAGVELVSVSDDSLTISHRGVTQAMPLASIVRLVRRSNREGRTMGMAVGAAGGALLGMMVSSQDRTPTGGWKPTALSLPFMGLGGAIGGFLGLAIGTFDYDVTTYDLSAMDVTMRRDTLLKLIAETK